MNRAYPLPVPPDNNLADPAGAGDRDAPPSRSALPGAGGVPLRAPPAPPPASIYSIEGIPGPVSQASSADTYSIGDVAAAVGVVPPPPPVPTALPSADRASSGADVPRSSAHHDVLYGAAPRQWSSENHLHGLLRWCREQSINDVTFGTGRRVIGKRHGSYRPIIKDALTSTDMSFLLGKFKEGAALSLGDTYRGSYKFLIDVETGQRFRVRVTLSHLTGSIEGQTATLRLIPEKIPTPADLDIPQEVLDAFNYKYGLGFVCGKMESGKTWTVAARLHAWLSQPGYDRKILHFGSPIEFLFDQHAGRDHIFQYEIPEVIKTYPDALKMAKSATPDIIVLEEVNDLETMSMIIDSAQSGIAVLGTLHISRVAELPGAMQTYFPNADQCKGRLYSIAEALKVILVQRLEPAIKDGDPTQRDGRVCVREYLVMDEAMRSELLGHETHEWSRILRTFVSKHGCSMIDSARKLHADGRLSADTLHRIETGRAT